MPPNNIPQIYVNSTGGLRYLSPIETGTVTIANINTPWMRTPPQAIPWTPPVTVNIGVPVVEMPGCVKIHKENAKNPSNKSSTLVNDDPNQNVVLCDGGMPYYEPPDYRADELTWQTVYGEPEEQVSGVDTGEPLGPPEADVEPPKTPNEEKEVPCPGPANLRVGDITQAGDERVVGHQLIPDPNNPKVNICETLYEPTTAVEKFLPSVNQTTTTVAIAVVATAGAAATPLLLRVFKPIITKIYKTIQQKLGKKAARLSRNDIIANEYRAKRGLPPIKVKGSK
jgi:hypothetical protein